MSETVVAQRAGAVDPPRALGSGDAVSREQLREAPIRSLPRPSLLAAPVTALRGAGPKLAAPASDHGIE